MQTVIEAQRTLRDNLDTINSAPTGSGLCVIPQDLTDTAQRLRQYAGELLAIAAQADTAAQALKALA